MTQRIQRHPFLALFDGPDTNTTREVRSSSIPNVEAAGSMGPYGHEGQPAACSRASAAARSGTSNEGTTASCDG